MRGSSNEAWGKQLSLTSLQQLHQQLASQRTQPVAQAAKNAGVSSERVGQHGARDSANPISAVLAGGAAGSPQTQSSNGGRGGVGGVMVPNALLQNYYEALFAVTQTQSSNGGSGGEGGVMGPGGQPLTAPQHQSSNGGSGGTRGVMVPGVQPLTAPGDPLSQFGNGVGGLVPGVQPLTAPQHQSSNGGSGEDQSSQFMKEKPLSVSSMSPQNRKRDWYSNKTTPSKKPRNREQLGTHNGTATSAVKRAPERKSSTNIKIIGTQKVTFKDSLYDVVSDFFDMANKFSGLLPGEMINKNQELVNKLSIITRKDDKEIGNISIDEMASAFKEFQECYTNVNGYLLANDDLNSNENLKTLVHQTCHKIDTGISTMLEHNIIKFQEIKQHFQSKVEEYESLGITLPAQEVVKINSYEYTSRANLKTFKTLVYNIINKLDKLQFQKIKQDFQSKVEEYKSLEVTLLDQEVKEINGYEYTSGANLTTFKTLVDGKIKKLKDQYIEKVKATLSIELAGYREAENVLKELNDRLDRVKTESLEEIKKVIKKCYFDIEARQAWGELTVKYEEDESVIKGLAEINKQIIDNQIFDDYHWT